MNPYWEAYFQAVKRSDLLAAFDAMDLIGLRPLALYRDDHGKVKKPVGIGWGKHSIPDRRKILQDTILQHPKDAGLGCQPFGYVVFDLDPPGKDFSKINSILDDFIEIAFGGEVYETHIVRGAGGLHIWYKATPAFLKKYGDQPRRKINMPGGGHVEIFVGSETGQAQVACAPSEGKFIDKEIEPADLPDVAAQWLIEIKGEYKATSETTVRCEVPAASDTWESGWFANRTNKLIDKIAAAAEGQLHFTLRANVRMAGGYAAGMGLEYQKTEIFQSVESALMSNGNCRSLKCAQKTMEWAWTRGTAQPVAPKKYESKRGTTIELPVENQKSVKIKDEDQEEEFSGETSAYKNQLIPYYDPFLTATEFINSEHQNRFVTWQGTSWQWRAGKYQEIRPDELRATIGGYIDHWFLINAEDCYARLDDPDEKAKYKKKPVTSGVIQSAFQAFTSISTIPDRTLPKMPYWIDRTQGDWDPVETIALRNCILNVRTKQTQDLSNRWFSKVRSNVDWTGEGSDCPAWKAFLESCFPNDPQSIELLQMFFGLCLTSNTSFQKILAMIGPPRSGKGTITRTMGNMIGPESVASLGIGDLAREFGLEKLIGVPVAIMPDVRFGSRDNVSDAIERILSISGEDEIRIARKYQSDWSGKLPTRIIMASNEMPRLPDAAAAIPTRLLVLQFTESHVGREDQTLHSRIASEMTGILAWAVEGYSKLLQSGKFPENDSTSNAIEEAKEIGSPAQAFMSDCIEVTGDETETLEIGKIYDTYKAWCGQTGRHPACIQTISKQIKDLHPKLRVARLGNRTETRKRCLRGLIFTDYGWNLSVQAGGIRSDF